MTSKSTVAATLRCYLSPAFSLRGFFTDLSYYLAIAGNS